MHSYSKADQDEEANNQKALLLSAEENYNSRISEIKERHKNEIFDRDEKVNKLERELKSLEERFNMEMQERSSGDIIQLQERVESLTVSEQNLAAEIKALKDQRDQSIINYQRDLDQSTLKLKNKIKDLERKHKAAEVKRHDLVYTYEKQRTKQDVEIDHLKSQKSEFQDQIRSLENKQEKLLRENEKLKTENRKHKKLAGFNGNNLSTLGGGYAYNLNTSKFDRSMLRGEARGTLASEKSDKENDFPTTKFSLLDKLNNNDGNSTSTPVKNLTNRAEEQNGG